MSEAGSMQLLTVGLTFHTAPVAVRERATVPAGEARTLLRYLVGHSGLCAASVLSTCNRTEFYLVAPEPELAAEVVPRLARYLDPTGSGGVAEHLGALHGADAVRQMLRVAAGLDSMVLGEAQVLGQFKAAHRIARQAGTLDARLDFAMRRALSAGKRVRTDTRIGTRAGSVGEAALEHARRAVGGLGSIGVLLIGAGKMSAAAARRLAGEGARLIVASRGRRSARELAEACGGTAVGMEELDGVVSGVDVVLCSTDSPEPVLRASDVERWQELRGSRPLQLLDIAVPRDVEPAASAVAGVSLVDIDALASEVERNLEGRRREVPAAERIVEAELTRTMAVIGERDAAAPTIAALARLADEVRARETDRVLARLGEVDATTREQIDMLGRGIVRKLLHAPIAHLKESAGDPSAALALREAFDLDRPDGASGKRPASR